MFEVFLPRAITVTVASTMAFAISSSSSHSKTKTPQIRWRFADSGRCYHFEVAGVTPAEVMKFYEDLTNSLWGLNIKVDAKLSDKIVTTTILYRHLPDTFGEGLYMFAESCCAAAGKIISLRDSNICVPKSALNYDSQLRWHKDYSVASSSEDEDMEEQEIDLDSFRIVEQGLARELALWCELRMALARV